MARFANEAPPAQIVAAVRILKRTKPLNATVAMSGVIGPRGGHLWIPEAGVEVRFAPGAVVSATRITLTAIEGTDVAYEFMPHGLKFSAPVVVRQDLKKTTAGSDAGLAASLQGSYFEGALAANLLGTHDVYARIKEGRQGKLNANSRSLEFTIEHFSGYMVSTALVAVDILGDWAAR